MSNPNPTPRLENLRPPWQKGTSGNPGGYSRGRRISDAIQEMIDEEGLQPEFARAAIAMSLGRTYMLRHKIIDPTTGVELWVEDNPNLMWFKHVQSITEPPAGQRDDMAVLNALPVDDDDYPPPIAECKARGCPLLTPRGSCRGNESVEPAGQLVQGVPAPVDSGQAVLEVPRTLARTGELERFHLARQAVQLFACLQARLEGLFTAGRLRARWRRWPSSPPSSSSTRPPSSNTSVPAATSPGRAPSWPTSNRGLTSRS